MLQVCYFCRFGLCFSCDSFSYSFLTLRAKHFQYRVMKWAVISKGTQEVRILNSHPKPPKKMPTFLQLVHKPVKGSRDICMIKIQWPTFLLKGRAGAVTWTSSYFPSSVPVQSALSDTLVVHIAQLPTCICAAMQLRVAVAQREVHKLFSVRSFHFSWPEENPCTGVGCLFVRER